MANVLKMHGRKRCLESVNGRLIAVVGWGIGARYGRTVGMNGPAWCSSLEPDGVGSWARLEGKNLLNFRHCKYGQNRVVRQEALGKSRFSRERWGGVDAFRPPPLEMDHRWIKIHGAVAQFCRANQIRVVEINRRVSD